VICAGRRRAALKSFIVYCCSTPCGRGLIKLKPASTCLLFIGDGWTTAWWWWGRWLEAGGCFVGVYAVKLIILYNHHIFNPLYNIIYIIIYIIIFFCCVLRLRRCSTPATLFLYYLCYSYSSGVVVAPLPLRTSTVYSVRHL